VELDDDDRPINQKKRDRVEKAGRRQGSLCRWACARSHDNLFLQYLSETIKLPDGDLRSVEWWGQNDRVARWIRWTCQIESRADLDNNNKAAELFHERIRRPYSEWRGHSED